MVLADSYNMSTSLNRTKRSKSCVGKKISLTELREKARRYREAHPFKHYNTRSSISSTAEHCWNRWRYDSSIVGGKNVPVGTMDSVVYLLSTRWAIPHLHPQHCTGVVVFPHWVLTARHCVHEQFDGIVTIVSLYYNATDVDPEKGKAVPAVARRAEYFTNSEADLAMIEFFPLVKSPKNNIVPACLPSVTISDVPDATQSCTAVGWGLVSRYPDTQPNFLQEITLKFSKYSYTSVYVESFQRHSGGLGPCHGDSGGPLFCPLNGKKVMVGILSKINTDCLNLGKYVRVKTYLKWIKGVMEKHSRRSPW